MRKIRWLRAFAARLAVLPAAPPWLARAGVLCLVVVIAIVSSGCLFGDSLTVFTFEGIVSISIAGVDNSTCLATGEPGVFDCFPDDIFSSGFQILSLPELLFRLILLDPLVVQVPAGVSNITGSYLHNDSGESGSLVITAGLQTVPIDVTRALAAEPGTQLVIIGLPAGAPLTGNFSFNLNFQVPPGTTEIQVKPIITGLVELTDGSVFYPPILPCVHDMAAAPALTISLNGGGGTLPLPPLDASLGCDGETYNFITAAAPPAIDHFQCYKSKDSQGSICGAGSPLNEGGVCTAEADCGGVEDETAHCVPRGFPKGLQVALADQFETGLFDVKKPLALCNPASKNGEDIGDPLTHLRGYQIKPAAGQARHVKQTGLRVLNQFHPALGELSVDTVKPDRLLVPTAKSLTEPVAPPDPGGHDVDHFKCYKVKKSRSAPKFARIPEVSIVDQFDQPRLVDVTKPTRLCTPVDMHNEGIENPAAHLMCYRTKAARQPPQPKHVKVSGIFVNNQLAPEQVDAVKVDEFCVPSTVVRP